MKKRLGIDIDAVLTYEGRGVDNIWHRYICDYFDLEERLTNDYNFAKAYNLTLEEVDQFMDVKATEIFKNVAVRPNCKEVLDRLKKKGYTLILVTARPQERNQITLEWLTKYHIPFDKLIHSDEKAEICQKEEIEFFIDDNPHHLISIEEQLNISIFLMDMDHNQDLNKDIPRVDNWLTLEKQIINIFE